MKTIIFSARVLFKKYHSCFTMALGEGAVQQHPSPSPHMKTIQLKILPIAFNQIG